MVKRNVLLTPSSAAIIFVDSFEFEWVETSRDQRKINVQISNGREFNAKFGD